MTKARGSCFCGSVNFEFELPAKFVANCHCSECRRASGAAFVTWVGTWETRLKVTQGADILETFRYPNPPTASRQFCKRCGSQLFFRGERWPEEVHITRACVDTSVEKEIEVEVFFSDKADWYDPNKRLPRLGGKTGTERQSKS